MIEMKPGTKKAKTSSHRDPRVGTSVGQPPPPRANRSLRADRTRRRGLLSETRIGESTDNYPRVLLVADLSGKYWIQGDIAAQVRQPHAIVSRQLQGQKPVQHFVRPVWYEMMGSDRATLVRRARELFGDRLAEVILTHDAERFDGFDVVAARTSEADLRPLAYAVRIADRLREVVGTDTIQAWFVGTNPLLNDEEPAIVIKTDPGAVWNAAKHFIAYA